MSSTYFFPSFSFRFLSLLSHGTAAGDMRGGVPPSGAAPSGSAHPQRDRYVEKRDGGHPICSRDETSTIADVENWILEPSGGEAHVGEAEEGAAMVGGYSGFENC